MPGTCSTRPDAPMSPCTSSTSAASAAGRRSASAQFGSPLDTRDVGFANAQIELEVQGSENLALDTGGFSVRNANDLNAALGRISRELSSYYLLGFQPSRPGADGAYRKLQVRVRRLGVTVRARKGYYVTGDRLARADDVLGHDALQPVTDSPYDLDIDSLARRQLCLRQSRSPARRVVSLAIEADLRAFGFSTTPTALTDVLELRIAATHLESSTAERYDGQVEMTFPLGTRFGEDAWYGMAREFTLAPGRYQARIAVRDRNNGRIGALTHVFDVPALDGLRVTTPIITDTVETPTLIGACRRRRSRCSSRGASSRPARRSTTSSACSAFARGARILAGHQVRDAAGTIIKQLEPRAITPAPDGALSRFGGLSMKGLPAGEYELTLTVIDEAASRTIQLREPFAILPPQGTP